MQPLRLSIGSNTGDSAHAYGCIMNVVSWINGDMRITDIPDCVDVPLALYLQTVNDEICEDSVLEVVESETLTPQYFETICPSCAMKLMDWGARAMGTVIADDSVTKAILVRVHEEYVRHMKVEIYDEYTYNELQTFANDSYELLQKALGSLDTPRNRLTAAKVSHASIHISEFFTHIGSYVGHENATELILSAYEAFVLRDQEQPSMVGAIAIPV